jgi:hypothetical protein
VLEVRFEEVVVHVDTSILQIRTPSSCCRVTTLYATVSNDAADVVAVGVVRACGLRDGTELVVRYLLTGFDLSHNSASLW